MEIWKDIYFVQDGIEWDFRGLYQVSSFGRVKSLGNRNSNNSKEKILKARKTCGYKYVGLYKNGGKQKNFYIHRLVAFMFLSDSYFDGAEVNHKNENKENNCVDNLEWCTGKYNSNYGTRNERMSESKKGKLIARYDLEMNLIDVHYNFEYVQLGFNKNGISSCCNGRLKSHKGFVFKYYEGDV